MIKTALKRAVALGGPILAVALSALLVFPLPGQASTFSKTDAGKTVGGFLKLGVGGRAMGMAGAFSAIADDATALYWNPAGMTRVEGASLSVMHATYLDEAYYDYGGYVHNFHWGALGFSTQYLSHGEITEIDANNSETGKFTPKDVAATIAYARRFRWFSLGISGKLVRSTILTSAQTGAADLGILSEPFFDERVRFSLVGSNMGGKLQFNEDEWEIPTVIRTGVSWQNERYTAAFDGVFPRDSDPYGAFGGEVKMGGSDRIQFAVRAGYNNRSTGDIDGAVGFTAGIGAAMKRMALDYAFVPMGGLGLTHRISMTFGFGGEPADGPVSLSRQMRKKARDLKREREVVASLPRIPQADPQQRYKNLMRESIDLIKAGKSWEALESVRKASAIKPLEPESHIIEGRILYVEGDRPGAERSFHKSVKLLSRSDKRQAYVHERLGRIAYLDGDYRTSKKHYQKVINSARRLEVKNRILANAYAGLGLCQFQEGARNIAIRNLRTGASLGTTREYTKEINSQFHRPKWNRKGYKGN